MGKKITKREIGECSLVEESQEAGKTTAFNYDATTKIKDELVGNPYYFFTFKDQRMISDNAQRSVWFSYNGVPYEKQLEARDELSQMISDDRLAGLHWAGCMVEIYADVPEGKIDEAVEDYCKLCQEFDAVMASKKETQDDWHPC